MIRRLLALTAVLAATLTATLVVTAPTAGAVPYPPTIRIPVLTASVYDPCAGAANVIGGKGFLAGETVVLVLTKTGEVGRTKVRADGTFQVTVKIPVAARGTDQLTVTGLTSHRKAQLTLAIPCVMNGSDGTDDNSSGGNGNGTDGANGTSVDGGGSSSGLGTGAGGLASTGAAVGGALLVGAVLLGAGGMLVVAGRRRRSHVS